MPGNVAAWTSFADNTKSCGIRSDGNRGGIRRAFDPKEDARAVPFPDQEEARRIVALFRARALVRA